MQGNKPGGYNIELHDFIEGNKLRVYKMEQSRSLWRVINPEFTERNRPGVYEG